jgi:endoglucanase
MRADWCIFARTPHLARRVGAFVFGFFKMRRFFFAVCVFSLLQVSVGTAAEPAIGAGAVRAALPANWTQGLRSGPNGPIPVIVVDQFGYPAAAAKFAVIRDPQVGYDSTARFTPGKTYALIELASGRIVKQAALSVWNSGALHTASGDKAWTFDFSDVTTPGRYAVLDLEKGVRSADFAIGDSVYRDAMKHAVRMFFYQRAGIDKPANFAGAAWADKASHLGAGQDQQSRPWPGTLAQAAAETQVKDLRGGWYDAGDYNKYTSWTARNIIVLLQAFVENPQAFSDDLGIPESGNGVPDILDEVKWGLDWLVRMQTASGALLSVQGLGHGSPPSAAKGGSFYGPATTAATLMGAAAFAYASKIYAARPEPALKAYAADLAKRAKTAWAWASANPSVVFYNNDNARQPGSQGLAAGQQEMGDQDRQRVKVEAAIYLYELTGDPAIKALVEANASAIVPSHGPTLWEIDTHEALLYYTRLPGVAESVKTNILATFFKGMTAHFLSAKVADLDPYRSPLKDYTWGSNKAKAAQGRLYQLAARYSDSPDVRRTAMVTALNYCHAIHGINPLGLVYLTNMKSAGASHSASTMFHAWFAQGTRWSKVSAEMPGPPPGYLVGGPTLQYGKDGCCTAPASALGFRCHSPAAASLCERSYAPPLGQPPLKAYLQFNDPWPANSWSITEPSTAYQAHYIRTLSAYVR